MLDIGVVVLEYGVSEAVPALVSRLLGEGIPPDAMVVVHNSNGEAAQPRPLAPGVARLQMSGNVGYAGGMNAGIRHHLRAGRAWALLLTPDTQVGAGAVQAVAAAATDAPGYGVLGPVVGWVGQDTVFSYGGIDHGNGLTSHDRAYRGPTEGIKPCAWIDGGMMLIRADVFREAGLLDPRFFLYFEETEFCLRARRAGWKVGIVLGALTEEEPGADRRPGAYAYLHARNGLEYARLAAGVVGVLTKLRGHLRELRAAVRLLVIPGTPDRRDRWVRLRCEWLGILHFALRRWGPPPALLPGRGDLGKWHKAENPGHPVAP